MKQTIRSEARIRRHERIRRVVRGTAARPRMCVHVSNRHIQVQFVDDDMGVTLAAVSTLGAAAVGRKSVDGAKAIGRALILQMSPDAVRGAPALTATGQIGRDSPTTP